MLTCKNVPEMVACRVDVIGFYVSLPLSAKNFLLSDEENKEYIIAFLHILVVSEKHQVNVNV